MAETKTIADFIPKQTKMTNTPEFDRYAKDYNAAIAPRLSLTGESKEYFARARVIWLSNHLGRLQQKPKSVLDFGCGTGLATPFFFDLLGVESVLGVDVSPMSLDVARRQYGCARVEFLMLDEYQPNEQIDLAFCNGVFHHIPLSERPAAVSYIRRSLRPGGLFALWENNPWNPIVRYNMNHAPIDRNAIPLTPPKAHAWCDLVALRYYERIPCSSSPSYSVGFESSNRSFRNCLWARNTRSSPRRHDVTRGRDTYCAAYLLT